MMLYYAFPSTDAAENAAAALRRTLPSLRSVYVLEDEPPTPDPEFAFFPINSITTSGYVGNYYPTLYAFNARVDAPPFRDSLLADPGDLNVPEYAQRSRARLEVCCEERDRMQVEAVVRAQPDAEPVSGGDL